MKARKLEHAGQNCRCFNKGMDKKDGLINAPSRLSDSEYFQFDYIQNAVLQTPRNYIGSLGSKHLSDCTVAPLLQ